MHMFNRQKNIIRETISKLRNHPDDKIEPLQPLQVKLDNLQNLFMAHKPVFSSARSILQTQPSFDGKPIPPSGRKKRSLLPFLSSALKWLTGTATTKDVKHIKKWISSLIKTGKSTKNNGTHSLHPELNPLQNPSQQTTDKHHLEGINEIQRGHKSTV